MRVRLMSASSLFSSTHSRFSHEATLLTAHSRALFEMPVLQQCPAATVVATPALAADVR